MLVYLPDPPPENGCPQGGVLDLYVDGRQRTLHINKAEFYDPFKMHVRQEGQTLKLVDKSGARLFAREPGQEDESEPEIDREKLQRNLLDIRRRSLWYMSAPC
jgi:hypothetical protein